MDLTPKKRSKIVTLSEHSSMTQRDIAMVCKVSLGAVNKIIKQYKETGSLSPQCKGKCGRKRKTTCRDDSFLLRKSKEDPRLTSFDLQK